MRRVWGAVTVSSEPFDFKTFGAPGNQFRCSSLTNLQKCRGLWLLRHVDDSGAGKAAHTGTAVGRAIELWHRQGEPDAETKGILESILEVVKEESVNSEDPFDLADWSNVEKGLTSYALDPRNKGVVLTESLEETVTAVLDPHPTDPTGLPITVRGHIDQARRDSLGRVLVWDLKNGKPDGLEMVWSYILQQSLYTVAYAQSHPEEEVRWGGIIRLQGYRTRERREGKLKDRKVGTHPVFFESPVFLEDIDTLLRMVTLAVSQIRRGEVVLTPGAHCNFCPAGGVTACIPQLRAMGMDV